MITWEEKMNEWLKIYAIYGINTNCPPLPPDLSWTGSGGPPADIEDLYDLTQMMVWHAVFTYQNMNFRIHCNGNQDVYKWEIV